MFTSILEPVSTGAPSYYVSDGDESSEDPGGLVVQGRLRLPIHQGQL